MRRKRKTKTTHSGGAEAAGAMGERARGGAEVVVAVVGITGGWRRRPTTAHMFTAWGRVGPPIE